MAVLEPTVIDQYQIGDEVVYVPEGVITTVTGYVWKYQVPEPPRILLYSLACGIDVPKDVLMGYISDRRPYTSVTAAIEGAMRANGR